jgi:hypothetical protein
MKLDSSITCEYNSEDNGYETHETVISRVCFVSDNLTASSSISQTRPLTAKPVNGPTTSQFLAPDKFTQ